MKITVDHILPRTRGGKDEPANWAVCCLPCNMAKGNKTAEEFRALRAVGTPEPDIEKARGA